ncbi:MULTISPECIES: benzoate 1,2-dioxygenase small subunit [Halomonas]|jgi:benzoate/toluate 1,2-dioxygenase beta subunit|uniref:Benzoate 1,2-dioxygenase small subunit n=1 Tax=Halomonas rhizosphaerae TaxID=3043296 RepID=A0ABT6UX95_9GAMM|nr:MULTISPECIES: benzoate 1,2-dioxygenase small subunit [Halomonas]MDI5890291.1 benzoate 1,2-dioxygenase small subunit [Halomonas rhizosphaerae]MDW7745457.1 benzoate 1,2-dioxygenase small subunit [Halomonas sp.]
MSISYHDIQAFLYREARLLDDRQWDAWLECYRQDAEFWMPAWDDDDQLTRDPEAEISLIYYPNREGLEDRVYRIKTERSGASTPEPRTTHQITNLEVLKEEGDTVELRFNWHTLSHRYKKTDSYFGSAFYTLDVSGETPLITRKVVQLNNDYIHQVIDIYHI